MEPCTAAPRSEADSSDDVRRAAEDGAAAIAQGAFVLVRTPEDARALRDGIRRKAGDLLRRT